MVWYCLLDAGTQPFSNPLLVRTELAKVKPTTYDLPTSGHTFGKALERDAEDAGAGTPPAHMSRRSPAGRCVDPLSARAQSP